MSHDVSPAIVAMVEITTDRLEDWELAALYLAVTRKGPDKSTLLRQDTPFAYRGECVASRDHTRIGHYSLAKKEEITHMELPPKKRTRYFPTKQTVIQGRKFTRAEMGLLYATKASESAQTLEVLQKRAKRTPQEAAQALSKLMSKGILEPIQNWDGTTVYGYQGSAFAQAVYCEIYRVDPIEL
jgi:hypothetical protein